MRSSFLLLITVLIYIGSYTQGLRRTNAGELNSCAELIFLPKFSKGGGNKRGKELSSSYLSDLTFIDRLCISYSSLCEFVAC